jgi:glycyl-tRNA synthetase beta chain
MGRYYAERSGEDRCVVAAMEEQYLPRHAGDRLPETPCGRVLSLADRLDTLVGIFAIGQRPTGVKDPYALRRASLGVLRLLIETPLELDLKELLEFTAEELRAKVDAKRAAYDVFAYVMDRLQGYYQDQQVDPDTVDAVLARSLTVPSDIDKRIRAVQTFRSLPQAKSLAAANKRIRNVLRKAEDDYPAYPDPDVLELEPEKVLNDRIRQLRQEIGPLLLRRDYAATLNRLSTLREAVDHFFDNVMVMVDDAQLRCNRLSLLHSLNALFLEVADISRLQPR